VDEIKWKADFGTLTRLKVEVEIRVLISKKGELTVVKPQGCHIPRLYLVRGTISADNCTVCS